MDNALDLAEIRTAIGIYLDIPSVKNCTLVNKLWHESFIPFLWSKVLLKENTHHSLLAGYCQYRPHIRQLTLWSNIPKSTVALLNKGGDSLEESSDKGNPTSNFLELAPHLQTCNILQPQCPRLQELHFERFRIKEQYSTRDRNRVIANLIREHASTLRVISFEFSSSESDRFDDDPHDSQQDHANRDIWDSISMCHHLQELELIDLKVDSAQWPAFWRACNQARTLTLNCIHYLYAWDSVGSADRILAPELDGGPSRVQIFNTIGVETCEDGRLLWMLEQLSGLKAISIHNITFGEEAFFPVQGLCTLLERGLWPDFVSFMGAFPQMPDRSLVMILERMSRVQEFGASYSGFGKSAFVALGQHFGTLQRLDLKSCPDVSSAMVRRVLEECPELWSLDANTITAKDILSSQWPWKCEGRLSHLEVAVEMTPISDEQYHEDENRKVLQRLSCLSRMERFRETSSGYNWERPVLELSLEKGLEFLASWRRLTVVKSWGSYNATGEDLEWMLNSWPKIETLYGNARMARSKVEELSQRILGRSVKVRTR